MGGEKDLSRKNLELLFNNKIGLIRVKNFLSEEECQKATKEINQIGIDYYKDTYPKIGKIGITQYELHNQKEIYFSQVEKYNKKLFNIHKIRNKIINLLKMLEFEVSIAYESSLQQEYFAGLIRLINNKALLHIDFAPRDAQGWEISQIDSQIAWNIFLETDENGGDGIVYNRAWKNDDEKYKLIDSYGYNYDVVKNCEKIIYKPKIGDLVFHNSRNFHEVKEVNGSKNRITLSSFIGKKNNKLLFWS